MPPHRESNELASASRASNQRGDLPVDGVSPGPKKVATRSPGTKRGEPTAVMSRSPVGRAESPDVSHISPNMEIGIPDDEIYFVTQETPMVVATQTSTGMIGLLNNVKNGEKGLAQFYHADVHNSGEEIIEFEKVMPNGDSRIRNGELVYLRSEGNDDEYYYLKGQSLSHKCTWGRHKESSNKSQFVVKILTNHGKGYLTEVDDFELHSNHWHDKFLALELSASGSFSDLCGPAVLSKGKGSVSRVFRAMETALEDRTVMMPQPRPLPTVHVGMPAPLKPLSVKNAETTQSAMKDCPYCGMLFSTNPDLISHIEHIHTRPSVFTTNSRPVGPTLSPTQRPSACMSPAAERHHPDLMSARSMTEL